MTDEDLVHQLRTAGVNHCLSFEQVCDEWIEEYQITEGNFDNITTCKYSVPAVTSIGRVYQTLILNVMGLYANVVEAIKTVYNSFISDEISDFNSNVFYSNPDYINVHMKQVNCWIKKVEDILKKVNDYRDSA